MAKKLKILFLGCSPIVGLVALVMHLQKQVVTMLLERDGWRCLRHLVSVWDIRYGSGERLPWFHQHNRDDQEVTVLMMGWKALFGIDWVHPVQKLTDLSAVTQSKDAEDRFCLSTLSYMWSHPTVSGFSYPSIYAGYEEQREWIKQCKAAWHELGEEEKQLLGAWHANGEIPITVLVPEPDNNERQMQEARARGFPAYESESVKYTREELVQLIKDSVSHSAFEGLVTEAPESMLEYYTMMNIRKPVEIPGTWQAVGEATRLGRITKFDARGLLAPELFNVTYDTLEEWEGAASHKIAVFGDGVLPASLSYFAAVKRLFEPRNSRISLAQEDLITVNALDKRFPDAVFSQLAPETITSTGYVHTRRLPAFHSKLPDIEAEMGIKEDVLRGQSMLWMSSTPGGFHFDEESNVYIQLSGVSFAFLTPQNWTDYMTGSVRHPWGSGGLPNKKMVEEDPELKNVPIFLVPLYPGDGLTLQGRTYHRFIAQTHDRIALNWFFIPAWRKMEYTPSDWYSIEASKSLHRLAVRSLWARTITKVFNETGRGVVYMGAKLEYL